MGLTMLKPQIKANKPCTGYAFILSNNKSLIASNDSCDTLDAKISSYKCPPPSRVHVRREHGLDLVQP